MQPQVIYGAMTARDCILQRSGIRKGQPKRIFTKSKIYKKG